VYGNLSGPKIGPDDRELPGDIVGLERLGAAGAREARLRLSGRKAHQIGVLDSQFRPDGTRLVTAGWDHKVEGVGRPA
jgi:hypothetical protein